MVFNAVLASRTAASFILYSDTLLTLVVLRLFLEAPFARFVISLPEAAFPAPADCEFHVSLSGFTMPKFHRCAMSLLASTLPR